MYCEIITTTPCQNGNPPLEVSTLNEDFESGISNAALALYGWVNVPVQGTRNWLAKEFNWNIYAQATAFNDTAPVTDMWLVTPLIVVNGAKTLTFETAKSFWTHDALTVWISTDFECNPNTATWVPLTGATLAGQSDVDNVFISSGEIDLSFYAGQKVTIGFRYQGNNLAGLTSNFRIDNLIVQ